MLGAMPELTFRFLGPNSGLDVWGRGIDIHSINSDGATSNGMRYTGVSSLAPLISLKQKF
jgi:hypothetical protein